MAYKKSTETRDRLLKAAARLFAKGGYYETGIGDIAREAGIGRASFYYYFEDKEKIARAVFDSYVDRILSAAEQLAPVRTPDDIEGQLLCILLEYLLLFKCIALNEATHAVYYDLVNYADYDLQNIDRLKRTTFKDTQKLAAAYGRQMSDDHLVAFIISTNALAKSLFKAILKGTLRFSLAEAADYFFSHAILPDIPIPRERYRALMDKALELCSTIEMD